jgi:transcription elongation GreA/GreB family factor
MSDTLDRIRIQLDQVIEEAAAAIAAHQAEAAAAIESITPAAQTAAAYSQGRHDERLRILQLIDEQQQTLAKGGLNALSLATLSRALQLG